MSENNPTATPHSARILELKMALEGAWSITDERIRELTAVLKLIDRSLPGDPEDDAHQGVCVALRLLDSLRGDVYRRIDEAHDVSGVV
jgi:hypothetical protein